MTHILKVLGLGLFAALAVSAFVAVSASASATAHTGGHFTQDSGGTATLHGDDEGAHQMSLHNFGATTGCNETYTGTVSAATATSITITPHYTECVSGGNTVTVNMNGCTYTFTVRDTEASVKHSPVHLKCPAGKKAEVIIHSTCTMTFGEQQITEAIVYTTITVNNKHAITADITATGISYEKHGLCEFLSPFGTGPHTGASLTGSVKLTAKNALGNSVNLTTVEVPNERIHSEVAHTLVTGSQVTQNAYTFGLLIGAIECEVVTIDGTVAIQTAAEITVKPAYSKCKGLNREVTTHMNGCAYNLKTTRTGNDGTVEIECPAGQQIETTVDAFPGGCTVTVGAQTADGVVDYKNEGAGSSRDLLVTWTLEGIDYERDGCEIGGKGNNGTLTGSVTLKGEDTSGVSKGIWFE